MQSFLVTFIIMTIMVVPLMCANLPEQLFIGKLEIPKEATNKPPEIVANDIVCKLPAVRGHCRALLPRWRYDAQTKQCHEFKFGGCDGNGNNFLTESECMKKCEGV